MSPIVTLQRQMREIGRIRTGNQIGEAGKRRPNKLGTFRLTSQAPEIIEAAARVYGGTVSQWDNGGSLEYEVVTESSTMPIVVPPGQVVSQWMEMWSGGGCLRRCDGVTNQVDNSPCACPQDVATRVAEAAKGRACKATTRLSVILPELPDLGVWRLESHGYNAAVHLAGAAEILAMATDRGVLIPARLRLTARSKKVPGQPTRQWFEPVIEFVETEFASLGITGPAPQLNAGRPQPAAMAQIAPPASSDFRAIEGEIIEHSPATVMAVTEPAVAVPPAAAGVCGWSLRPKAGGADIPCTFAPMHGEGHSWHEQRAGGRVVPPA